MQNIWNKTKFEEILMSYWTKFIDYKYVFDLITNNIKLYSSDWTIIQEINTKKNKQLNIRKFEIVNDSQFRIWFDFEIPWENKDAVGSMEIYSTLNGKFSVTQFVGNFYY